MKKGIFGLAAALAVLAVVILAVTVKPAKADTGTDCTNDVTLDVLANAGLLKLNGRTVVQSGYLQADYSGTGFETNITAAQDTELKVVYSTTYTNKLSVFVDGEIAKTELFPGVDGEILVPISKGSHTIKVVKESQLSSSKDGYFRLVSIGFQGTVDSKPADKDFLVEVIGDSYSCGDGADARYESGTKWTGIRDDAITKSFGWYLSEMLDADFNEVGRGGQGLDGTAAQESQSNSVTMPILFDYASYADQAAGKLYTATRIPDLVVIELGANDSHSAANKATWVNIAKNFTLKIKDRYGDIPIVWSLTTNKSHFYTGLRDAFENDADLAAYDNLYVMYNYLMRNGSAALATQKGGHPDAIDQQEYAERLYNFIQTEGVLGTDEEPEHPNDLVYYVSASGDNEKDGLTAATAKKTVASAVSAALTAMGTEAQPNGTRVVLEITGSVTLSSGQNLLSSVTEKTIPVCQDGSKVLFVLKTYNYDGSNRATLKDSYAPSNSGSSSSFSYTDVYFKDVLLSYTGKSSDGKYAVNRIFNQNGNITFDNVTVKNSLGTAVSVYANGFNYNATLHNGFINGSEENTNVMTFLNGVYDSTTGFGTIAAVGGVGNYYKSGGSYTEAPGLTCKILVGKGATVGSNLKLTNNTLSVKEAVVEVTTGGKVVGEFLGTQSGTSDSKVTLKENLTVNVTGGHFYGPFHFTGNYLNITGDLTFNMTGGEIVVPPQSERVANSVSLGQGTGVTLTGNSTRNISGGTMLIYEGITSGSAKVTAGIYFSGFGGTISGKSTNNISAGAFVFIPDATTPDTASGIYFGGYSSLYIKGELINRIEGGIFDQTQLGGTYYFGSQAVSDSIKKLTNIIGVQTDDGRNEGPVFLGDKTISMGSGWGQYGVTSYSKTAVTDEASITSDTVVISNTIYGGQFSGTVYLAPSSTVSTTNGYYPRTQGSILSNIYNGDFEGTLDVKMGGDVYGHVECNIYGGHFSSVYGVNSANAYITDGFTMNIYDMVGYGKAADKEYTFKPVTGGTIKTLTAGRNALECNVEGGYARMNLVLDNAGNYAVGSTSVKVNGGWFGAVSGSMATGAVYGGSFKTAPDASYLAAGKTVVDFAAPVDQYFTCEVTDGTASHTHCECVGKATGVGSHVCDNDTAWTGIASMEDLAAAVKAGAPMDGYYYLLNDIKLTAYIKPLQNQNLHICLNGHALLATGTRVVMMYSSAGSWDATLSITDCSAEETGLIAGGYHEKNGGNILVFSNCDFNLFAGTIADGQTSAYSKTDGTGANINVASGSTFNMYGGTIKDGKSYGHSGNVTVSGTMNMYGGTISGGRSIAPDTDKEKWLVGGNVYASAGEFNMYGGTIQDGKSNYGGNIYGNKTINLFGGTVTGGEAIVRNGGNVLIDKNGALNVSGSAVIENGKAIGWKAADKTKNFDGGNVYIQGSMTMTGGTIRDGRADHGGGNIYASGDSPTLTLELTGGTITGGKARIGGGISVNKSMLLGGTLVVSENEAVKNPATGGDGHGGNLYVSTTGAVVIDGATLKDGIADSNGGANISCTGGSASLEFKSGLISGGKTPSGDNATSSVHYFAVENSVFKMTGGTIIVNSDTAVALNMSTTKAASITGGKINGKVEGSSTGFISGGYFTSIPDDQYLAADHQAFDLSPVVTESGKSFNYEIAKGYKIELTSREENGTESIATVTGGGKYKENASYTLIAPNLTSQGYTFLQWEDATGTKVSEEMTITGTATENLNLTAVYKSEKKMLKLTVNGSLFTVKLGNEAAETFEGTVVKEVAPGTPVQVVFTNEEKNFAAWINESNRYVSMEETYDFDMYFDRELTAEEPELTANASVIYLNTSNQVLRVDTVTDSFTAYSTTPPDRLGLTNGKWDLTVAEIDALVKSGETKIELHPVYESKEMKGTITVKKVTADETLTTFTEITDGTTSETYPVENLITFTAETMEGYKFAGFADAEKKMVSYSDTMKVRPADGKETVIYMVYVATEVTVEDEVVVQVSFADYTNDAKSSAKADVTRHIPETFTILEQGMVISQTKQGITDLAMAETELVLGGDKVSLYHSANTDNDGILSLNMKNLPETGAAFIRGYVIYVDSEGTSYTVYSEIVELTRTGITISK